MLRLDEIHPEISGNKWFKLKYNLEEARKKNHQALLTFGGAFSNHLLATAAAGKHFGLKTIGVVRGEELDASSNPLLNKCADNGMQLHFVTREEYREKETLQFIEKMKNRFGNFFMIPEGGSNFLAVKGASEILDHLEKDFDFVCCACGTGGTVAGLSKKLGLHQRAVGIAAVNAPGYFERNISFLLGGNFPENLVVNYDYHFGAYAKSTPELLDFADRLMKRHKMPVDAVYNAKLFYGIYDLAKKNFFPLGSRVVCLNTGG